MKTIEKRKRKPRVSPVPTVRLSDLPDVLTTSQYCAVFGISESHFWVLKRHNALPVPPLKLKLKKVCFSNTAVKAFIDGSRKAS